MPFLSSRFSSLHFHTPISLPPHLLFTNITTVKSKRTMMSTNLSHSPISPSKSTSKQQQEEQQHLQQEHLNQVLKYHNQTKHSFNHYARGPHGLDWANQPNPFRRYLTSPLIPLQHLPPQPQDPLYPSLFHSPLPSPPQPLSLSSISQFLFDSLSLSAWKTTGFSTWSLRVNPSSGNLHPTEAYIISPSLPSLSISSSSFVAHYAPKQHALELRTQFPSSFFRFFPENSFLVGISSIFWRESWKYGERAFRYCNHDAGHAIAALAFAAASLGWNIKLLDGLGVSDLERVMGLESCYPQFKIPSRPIKGQFPGMEFEHPDCLLLVFPNNCADFAIDYAELSSAIAEFSSFEWKGNPNSLSKDHVCWDIIYRTAEVVKKPLTVEMGFSVDAFCSSGSLLSESFYKDVTMREVVRKRRSAVDMDGVHVMERTSFYQILLHCLPSGSARERGEKQGKQLTLPFRVLPWDSELHAVLFVHRVKELPKGLYFLVRNEGHFESLKRATRPEFEWEKPEGCPDELPLFRLARSNCQQLAKQLSCHQVF